MPSSAMALDDFAVREFIDGLLRLFVRFWYFHTRPKGL